MNTIGGLTAKIIFHEVKDIISMEINNENISISLKPGAIPVILNIVPETGNYAVEENNRDGETYFESSINAVVADVNRSNSSILNFLAKHPTVAVVESLRGNKKIFGTKDQPISFSYSERISETHAFNGYNLKITANSEIPPLFLI